MKKLSIFSLIVSFLFIFSCEDKVEKDTTPPELTIVSPTSGSTIGEIVQIKVQTTDESGILKVDFYIQNSIVLSDTTLPYEYEWNTTTNQDGEYKVKVVSFDTKENFVESEFSVTVDNESKKPTVTEIDSINYSYDKQSFEIYWTKNTDTDFKSYIIYESENEDMSSKTEITELTDQSTNNYDTQINSGLIRYYQIEVEDNFGLKSQSDIKKGSSWITFTKTYGSGNNDMGLSVRQTTDGGYIVSGGVGSNGESDIYLIKTDYIGNNEWDNTFSFSVFDQGNSVQQTTDGGYVILGITGGHYSKFTDIMLIKTDSQGIEEWNKTFGGNQMDLGNLVQQTTDGGYIIIGSTGSFGTGKTDVWLIKTNSQGTEEWSKTFGGEESDYGRSVQQTTDGGYIITGNIYSNGNSSSPSPDFLLIKTDSQGNEEWNKTFGGNQMDWGYSVQQTTDGGYIITGFTESIGNGGSDVWLIKTNSQGTEEWSKTFGGDESDYGHSVQQTTDGGYVIIGKTESYGNGNEDLWLIKTDTQGNEEWNKTFGGDESDIGNSVQQTLESGYIITGKKELMGDRDLWLIKTDSNGDIE